MPQPPRTTTFDANGGCHAKPTRGATLLKSPLTVESYFASCIWLRSIGVPGATDSPIDSGVKPGWKKGELPGTWKPGSTPSLRGDVRQVVVADAAVCAR